jgi:hypothetical protein
MYPYRLENERNDIHIIAHTRHTEEKAMWSQEKIEVMQPQAKECQPPPEIGKSKK